VDGPACGIASSVAPASSSRETISSALKIAGGLGGAVRPSRTVKPAPLATRAPQTSFETSLNPVGRKIFPSKPNKSFSPPNLIFLAMLVAKCASPAGAATQNPLQTKSSTQKMPSQTPPRSPRQQLELARCPTITRPINTIARPQPAKTAAGRQSSRIVRDAAALPSKRASAHQRTL
jgi:hypothetical protein